MDIDVSVIAISLSILFSVVMRSDLVSHLSEGCVFAVFHRCLMHICDPRLTGGAGDDAESMETCQQIVRAFNMTIVKLAHEANSW